MAESVDGLAARLQDLSKRDRKLQVHVLMNQVELLPRQVYRV